MSSLKDSNKRFRARIASWTIRLNVRPKQVRVQRMTRKWASCSSAGRVSFSTDLLGQPEKFQDYVIVHELLHLRIRNHGKLFKNLLSLYSAAEGRGSAAVQIHRAR